MDKPHVLLHPGALGAISQMRSEVGYVFFTLVPLIDRENNVLISVKEEQEWARELKELCDEGLIESLGEGMYFVNPIVAKHPNYEYNES